MSAKDFFQWVTTCDLKKVQKYFQTNTPNQDIINYQNNNGNTPLMQACNVNSPDNSQKLVKALLEVGAKVDIANQNGDRALIFAARKGYHVVVNMLVATNCEFDFVNQNGQRPLDLAANEATKSILQKLHDEKSARERAQLVQELSYQLLDMIFNSYQPRNSKTATGPTTTTTEIIDFLKKYASDYPEILEFESLEARHKKKRLLAACVLAQNLQVIEFLLQTYPSIEVDAIHSRCSGYFTPLMLNCATPLWPTYPQSPDARAAEETRHSISRLLLSRMTGIKQTDKDGATTLMKAVENNHANDVDLICQRFASPAEICLDAQDKYGITALHRAAKKKYFSIVQRLLALKPAVNCCDERGMTALMWSAWGGDADSLVALLDAGATPDLRSECGRTALLWAIERRQSHVVEILVSRGADPNEALPLSGSSPLLIASRLNSLQSASLLIKAGARMNEVNSDGLSPLMWAAWNNQYEIVDVLLQNGASPHVKDRIGKCALDYSKSELVHKKINEEMVKISVEKKFET